MKNARISFGEGHLTLQEHEGVEWKLEEGHDVEFFPGKWFHVLLTCSESEELEEVLKSFEDGDAIAIDLEWNDEICLFQFCSSNGVLIIRHPRGRGSVIIQEFLERNRFYGKGMANDRKKLFEKFHCHFPNMEDIEATRLRPYGHSDNFHEMTRMFAGEPTAEFKDLAITTSNWEVETLSSRQVLYAAFDVVALFVAYPKFPPCKACEKKKQETGKKATKPKADRPSVPKGPRLNERVTLIERPAVASFSYLSSDYHGTRSLIELRKCFQALDFVSTLEVGGTVFLFVSVFSPLDASFQKEWKLVQLPNIEVEESGRLDVLFVTNIPTALQETQVMSEFLFCFGVDQIVTHHEKFVRIEPRNAQCSYRMETFIPQVVFDGTHMQVFRFPFFLPRIRLLNLPPTTTEADLLRLLPTATNIDFIRRRNDSDTRKVELDLRTTKEADETVEALNYSYLGDNQIFATRYTDEVQRRHMRTYELVVFSDEDHKQLHDRFSRYGRVFQAVHDPRFGLGHVQFYRKTDAARAISDTARFNVDGSTAVVRELSLQLTEEEVCEIFSRFGTIRNLVFRDMSPWHLLSVVDITYSNAEEAWACKAQMNRTKLKEAHLHVSIQKQDDGPDWKMTQMNQWVKATDLNAVQECQHFADVIDYNEAEGEYFVMFKDVESASRAVEQLGVTPITKYEFVHKTTMKNLEYSQVASVPQKANVPQATAIVLDPCPEYLDEDKMMELCKDCGTFELHIVPSLINPTESRIIVYTRSRAMTKKVFTILCCQRYNGELLKPRKMKPDEVPDPPARVEDPRKKYGTKPLIEIDPIPDAFTFEDLHLTLPESAEWWIEGSATVSGCRRLIIKVKDGKLRKDIVRELTNRSDHLKARIIKAHLIRLPLDGQP